MSAFLVQTETINKVVSFMLPPDAACEDGDKLGRQLLIMNHSALNEHYGDDLPAAVKFTYRHDEYKLIDVVKAMHCLRYQCSEGDVFETDLYKELDDAIRDIESEIVHALPQYESAHWG